VRKNSNNDKVYELCLPYKCSSCSEYGLSL